MAENIVKITEQINKVVLSSPGPQGPRGKSILSGPSAPLDSVGIEGDFYFNTTTNEFYGPKLSITTWSGANKIDLATKDDIAFVYSWEMSQV
jgi:hypothetical protein